MKIIKWCVCIPSKGRSKVGETFKKIIKPKKFIFVPIEESEEYRRTHDRSCVVPVPKAFSGIHLTRQFILDWAQTWGYDRIIMADDDLVISKRISDSKFERMEVDIDEACENLIMAMGAEYVALSLPGRFLANTLPRGVSPFKRLTTFWSVKPSVVDENEVRYGKVPVQEDILFGLELLLAGLKTGQYCEYAHDQAKGYEATGGCSTYRNEQMLRQSSETIARLYPEFVKTFVRKASSFKKSSNENGERLEVRVQWKKAYLSTQD